MKLYLEDPRSTMGLVSGLRVIAEYGLFIHYGLYKSARDMSASGYNCQGYSIPDG